MSVEELGKIINDYMDISLTRYEHSLLRKFFRAKYDRIEIKKSEFDQFIT